MAIRIGINGFGRIGRQVYKAIRQRYDKEIDVIAVNDIGRISIMTHLLAVRFANSRLQPGESQLLPEPPVFLDGSARLQPGGSLSFYLKAAADVSSVRRAQPRTICLWVAAPRS